MPLTSAGLWYSPGHAGCQLCRHAHPLPQVSVPTGCRAIKTAHPSFLLRYQNTTPYSVLYAVDLTPILHSFFASLYPSLYLSRLNWNQIVEIPSAHVSHSPCPSLFLSLFSRFALSCLLLLRCLTLWGGGLLVALFFFCGPRRPFSDVRTRMATTPVCAAASCRIRTAVANAAANQRPQISPRFLDCR